jgi:hypothetical protein
VALLLAWHRGGGGGGKEIDEEDEEDEEEEEREDTRRAGARNIDSVDRRKESIFIFRRCIIIPE